MLATAGLTVVAASLILFLGRWEHTSARFCAKHQGGGAWNVGKLGLCAAMQSLVRVENKHEIKGPFEPLQYVMGPKGCSQT